MFDGRVEAESKFRRVRGYRDIAKLDAALNTAVFPLSRSGPVGHPPILLAPKLARRVKVAIVPIGLWVAMSGSVLAWLVASQGRSQGRATLNLMADQGLAIGFPPRVAALLCVGILLNAGALGWLLRSPELRTGKVLAAVASTLAINSTLSLATFGIAPGTVSPAFELADLRSASKTTGTNVILIVLDTVGARHLPAYGYDRPTTPRLAALAAKSTLYEHAYANATSSLPSHASMLTGLLPHQHGARNSVTRMTPNAAAPELSSLSIRPVPLDDRHTTLAERLRQAGHHTSLIAANYGYFAWPFGLTQGFEYVDNRPRNLAPVELVSAPLLRQLTPSRLISLYERAALSVFDAEQIVAHTLDWLDDPRRPAAPFFLLANFMDAHEIQVVDREDGPLSDLGAAIGARPPLSSRDQYDVTIRYLDAHLGQFLDELAARDLFEDSLIIVTSDHGERFSADGSNAHSIEVWESLVHVPLIVKRPGQQRGSRDARPVQLAGIYATILAELGIDQPDGAHADSWSSASAPIILEAYFAALGGSEVTLGEVASQRPTSWAIVDGRWKLIKFGDGRALLFDVWADPDETDNQITRQPDVAARLADALGDVVTEEVVTAHLDVVEVQPLDSETLRRLRSLGYVQ